MMEENTNLRDFVFYFEDGQVIRGEDFKLEDYTFKKVSPSSDRIITIRPNHRTSVTYTLQNAKFSQEMLKPFYQSWIFAKKSKKYIHYIKHSKKKRTRIKYAKMYMSLCEKYKIRR